MGVAVKNRSIARKLVAAGVVFAQALSPCLVVAQSTQGGPSSQDAVGAAAVGLANTLSGNVYMRVGTGPEVLMKQGDVFGPGTTFRTAGDSTVVLLFADGQNITLSKESVLRVDAYRFDANSPLAGQTSIGLLSGVMSIVTGAIQTSNSSALRVSVGGVPLGITGKDVTAFTASVDSATQGLGYVAVTVGNVLVPSSSGPVVVLASQFVRAQPGSAPMLPLPLAAAPAVIQSQVAASQATVLAESKPVNVQTASLLAALAALPPTAAGQPQPPAPAVALPVLASVVPSVTPGGGGTCTGSPC